MLNALPFHLTLTSWSHPSRPSSPVYPSVSPEHLGSLA